MQSRYETLRVPQAAKPEQIKRRYRTLVKRFHPDLSPIGSDAEYDAGERLRNINAAYAVSFESAKQGELRQDTEQMEVDFR